MVKRNGVEKRIKEQKRIQAIHESASEGTKFIMQFSGRGASTGALVTKIGEILDRLTELEK